MRRKATLVVLGIVLGACGFQKEQLLGDAGLPAVSVGFTADESLQDESSGSIQVIVRLSRPAPEPIDVSYSFSGGNALFGTDFTSTDGATEGTLSFATGQTELGIPLTIALDSEEEGDETIELSLSGPTAGAELGRARHTITISAKMLPRVNFSLATSVADEGNGLTLNLMLDSPPLLESTATIAVKSSSTAALDFDWQMPINATVTFPINSLSQTLDIPITNDMVDEVDETIVFEIMSTSNVVIGTTTNERTHTIRNDDLPPTVSITTASGATAEGNPPAVTEVTVTVSLSGPSGKPVTVPVTFGGGNATETEDYTYAAKTALVFMPNQNPALSETAKTVTINIVGDLTDENNQTIITSLTTPPTNATLSTTLPLTHTQTITDDDNPPSVVFTTPDGSAPEGDNGISMVSYVCTISRPSEKPISFDIALTGTATMDQPDPDYSTTPGAVMDAATITIAPGATTGTLTLNVFGEERVEGADETIIMNISNMNLLNVTRGAMVDLMRTHTIDDTDPNGG